ncbi:hypothetical protein GMRT_10482 [Giardia muris]|uniref:Uncharacterized protein n=1 Tax=Giardia muris TaxID=5742 RepID=A0A4Z1T0U5_GIAMU|nr:hypothetical protein GMRT_10482 [Giardia muris]|eukprot:TNJ26527.1 hypothetical protein GMRT_10482 [Giardia muris]
MNQLATIPVAADPESSALLRTGGQTFSILLRTSTETLVYAQSTGEVFPIEANGETIRGFTTVGRPGGGSEDLLVYITHRTLALNVPPTTLSRSKGSTAPGSLYAVHDLTGPPILVSAGEGHILVALGGDVEGYQVPKTPNLTTPLSQAFWATTGDLVTHMGFLEARDTRPEYVLVSRDKYVRHFIGDELEAEFRLPDLPRRTSTQGRFILVCFQDACWLLHATCGRIVVIHKYSPVLDAVLLWKPSTPILRPSDLTTEEDEAWFRGIRGESLERLLRLDPSDIIPLIAILSPTTFQVCAFTLRPEGNNNMLTLTTLQSRPYSGTKGTIFVGPSTSSATSQVVWVLTERSLTIYIVSSNDMINAHQTASKTQTTSPSPRLEPQKATLDRFRLLAGRRSNAIRQHLNSLPTNGRGREEYTFDDLKTNMNIKGDGVCLRRFSFTGKTGVLTLDLELTDSFFVHSVVIRSPLGSEFHYPMCSIEKVTQEFCKRLTGTGMELLLGKTIRDHNSSATGELRLLAEILRQGHCLATGELTSDVWGLLTQSSFAQAAFMAYASPVRQGIEDSDSSFYKFLSHPLPYIPPKESESTNQLSIPLPLAQCHPGDSLDISIICTLGNPTFASSGAAIHVSVTTPLFPEFALTHPSEAIKAQLASGASLMLDIGLTSNESMEALQQCLHKGHLFVSGRESIGASLEHCYITCLVPSRIFSILLENESLCPGVQGAKEILLLCTTLSFGYFSDANGEYHVQVQCFDPSLLPLVYRRLTGALKVVGCTGDMTTHLTLGKAIRELILKVSQLRVEGMDRLPQQRAELVIAGDKARDSCSRTIDWAEMCYYRHASQSLTELRSNLKGAFDELARIQQERRTTRVASKYLEDLLDGLALIKQDATGLTQGIFADDPKLAQLEW